MLKAFVISTAVAAAPPFDSPARVQRDKTMGDVAVGDHSFIMELLSTEGQSPLVLKGAFFDLSCS